MKSWENGIMGRCAVGLVVIAAMLCMGAALQAAYGAPVVTADLVTTGPWVDSRAYATINAAEAAAYAAGKTLKVFVPQVLAASLTVRCALDIEPGGKIIKASGHTLTVNGPFRAPDQQVFQGFGTRDIKFGSAAISEAVRVNWFAANTTPGTTDMADAAHTAINAAAGRLVLFGIGEYRMTSSLDHNVTATEIRVRGAVPAYITHGVLKPAYTYSADYTPQSIDIPSDRFTVIQMDGANLIGADDAASVGSSGKLRYLANILAYGKNNAKIGIYAQTYDTVIEDSHFALFRNFGILFRGGMTGTVRRVAYTDNGWGLTESGTTAYPYTYYSGCQYKVVSNYVPGDYASIDPAKRATTINTDTTFFTVRGHMVRNMSGYRGAQVSGLYNSSMRAMQGYIGSLFVVSTVSLDGLYVENYAMHGLSRSDSLPHCIYSVFSNLAITTPFMANNGVPSMPVVFQNSNGTGGGVSNAITQMDALGLKGAIIRSEKQAVITVGTPGGAPAYRLFSELFSDLEGFTGLIFVTIVQRNNSANYATAIYAAHRHTVAGVLKAPASLRLQEYHSSAAGYLARIAGVAPNATRGLDITIDWGASWDAKTEFHVTAGVIGSTSLSSP